MHPNTNNELTIFSSDFMQPRLVLTRQGLETDYLFSSAPRHFFTLSRLKGLARLQGFCSDINEKAQ